MKELGIIGYLAQTGIGVMCDELARQMDAGAQLAIPHPGHPLAPSTDRAIVRAREWSPSWQEVKAFAATGVKVAATVETDWGRDLFRMLHEAGIRVALLPMFEWWEQGRASYEHVDLWIATTWQCYQGLPYEQKTYLPWPVDLNRIPYRHRTGKARTFVHNAGNIGCGGRKGTREAVEGFLLTRESCPDIRLILNSQQPLDADTVRMIHSDPRIDYRQRTVADFGELYREGEVLIYVSHYDGQSLVGEEGAAAGMAVITTDAAPMNEMWEGDRRLLVKVGRTEPARTCNRSTLASFVDPYDLAEKIAWCADNDLSGISLANRRSVECGPFNWENSREYYLRAFRRLAA